MKKVVYNLLMILCICLSFVLRSAAQAPSSIPYQAVARDAGGVIVPNRLIGLRISIHDNTSSGAVVYSESQSVTTTVLGSFTANIGQGTSLSGAFNTINWGGGSKFIQIEMDILGGTAYVDMGTKQMLSVPYALYVAGKSTSVAMPTIQIGNQLWSKNNLDVSFYRNGNEIPYVDNASTWTGLTTGAWCYYNNDPANGEIYGKLYNWYAVNDARGLAPQGWHIPTDAEWTTLTTTLGGTSLAGGKMKSAGTTRWTTPNTGATNSSGFAGLPGGYRYDSGSFDAIGFYGGWWSSTETEYDTTSAWGRVLGYYYSNVDRGSGSKTYGFSVRCLRD